MTSPGARAGRVLARQHKNYPIVCVVCGRRTVRRSPSARICGRPHCVYEARKQHNARKEAQP